MSQEWFWMVEFLGISCTAFESQHEHNLRLAEFFDCKDYSIMQLMNLVTKYIKSS